MTGKQHGHDEFTKVFHGKTLEAMKPYTDEQLSISHALMHLRENKIHIPDSHRGWYSGNRKHFIARHLKAIALLEAMLISEEKGESSR